MEFEQEILIISLIVSSYILYIMIIFLLTRCPGHLCFAPINKKSSNSHDDFDKQLCSSCYELYQKYWLKEWNSRKVIN